MTQAHDRGSFTHLTAWGDESMRFGLDTPAYVLAAALVGVDALDDVRDVMRPLRVAGNKLHWRDLDPRQRTSVVGEIAKIDALHVAVIAAPMDPRRQERARAKCIQQMLAYLGGMGVGRFVLEQRTESLNARDQTLVTRLRGTRSLPASLTVGFDLPSKEPLLWIPDIVAGAVGDELADPTTTWAAALGMCLERISVDLRGPT